jgi:acyl-coenzyme A thioesterase PaaI-like protein
MNQYFGKSLKSNSLLNVLKNFSKVKDKGSRLYSSCIEPTAKGQLPSLKIKTNKIKAHFQKVNFNFSNVNYRASVSAAVFLFLFANSTALCDEAEVKTVPKRTSQHNSEESNRSVEEQKEEEDRKEQTIGSELDERNLERFDLKMMELYGDFTKDHLLHDTLNGEDKISDMKIYRDVKSNEVIVTCSMGQGVSGHPNIVHGGATAALLDNSFGYAFFATNVGNGFTANLNIDYRAPIMVGSKIILTTRASKVEGRKVYLTAEIRSRNEDDYDKLYVEAKCLFITSSKLKKIEGKI